MDYLDFVIEIGAADGDTADRPVEVISSPAGEARGVLRLPLGKLELENRLQALQIALLRAGGGRRRIASVEEQTVQSFGQELFGAVFRDEILSRYDVSRHDAQLQGKGLRIKLRFDDAALAGLPWEYLYDARQADYLSRSLSTPLVRSIELPRPIEPLTVSPPLRILALVASPSDMDPLDVDHERQRVESALGTLSEEGRVELVWLQRPTWETLQRALHRGPWHIFHFVGHGGYDPEVDEGVIILTDEAGRAHRLPAAQLGALLGDHFPMRLAFLNSCEGARGGATDIFSSTAAALVRRGTPAVVAMQYEVTDGAAIQFSRSFYTAVADGLPVDASVSAARMGVWLADSTSLEWGTPVLYMRARDGGLFRIEESARPAPRPERAPVEASAETGAAPSTTGAEPPGAAASSAAGASEASTAPGADLIGRGVGAAVRWGQQAAAAAREAARAPTPARDAPPAPPHWGVPQPSDGVAASSGDVPADPPSAASPAAASNPAHASNPAQAPAVAPAAAPAGTTRTSSTEGASARPANRPPRRARAVGPPGPLPEPVAPPPPARPAMPRFCTNCGAKRSPATRFCTSCGTGFG